MKLKGTLLVLASSFMFGSYGIWSRLIGNEFDNFYQAYTRGFIIALLMLPLLIKNKSIVKIKKSDRKWLLIYALFTSLTQAPIYYAFNNMDIGTATLLFFSTLMLTMVAFGALFLGEKLTISKISSVLIALIGLFVIYRFSISAAIIFAAIMAIVNGIASGGEIASSKKLTGNYSGIYVAWISWVVIAITNAPISLLLGEHQRLPSFQIEWLWYFAFIIASMFGYGLVIVGAKFIDAGVAGLIGLLEIIFSIVLAYLIFSEAITTQTAIGGILILIAAALPNISLLKQKAQSA